MASYPYFSKKARRVIHNYFLICAIFSAAIVGTSILGYWGFQLVVMGHLKELLAVWAGVTVFYYGGRIVAGIVDRRKDKDV